MKYVANRLLLKGRHPYPIGTERMHGGVKVKKTNKGWVPVKNNQQSLFESSNGGFKYREPLKDDKKISELINKATPATRNNIKTQLFGFDPKLSLQPKPYKFKPKNRKYNNYSILDYSDVAYNRVSIMSSNDIMQQDHPSHIPKIDNNFFKEFRSSLGGYEFNAVPQDDNNYIIHDYKGNPKFKVSIDVLALMTDYYQKKKHIMTMEKRQHTKFYKKGKARVDKLEDEIRVWIKERGSKPGPLRFKTKDLWDAYAKIHRREWVMTPRDKMLPPYKKLLESTGLDEKEILQERNLIRLAINQKLSDMKMQAEDWASSFAREHFVAFGAAFTDDSILESHGVLVKRQDGTEIESDETEFIKSNLSDIYEVFGDISSMAKESNLRITYSGNRNLSGHPQTKGIFFVDYKTIAITSNSGEREFGFTLAHEVAHYLDSKGSKSTTIFASDDNSTDEYKISSSLRENIFRPIMVDTYGDEIGEDYSEYLLRTHECFARALEQYYAETTLDQETYKNVYLESITAEYASEEHFNKILKPMIKKYLENKKYTLKSLIDELSKWDII